ncbi:NAD(P)-binding protein [Parathielavia appendiculata]|uniref:NAD(P)-binding protein n=1 Tax=Parathielavia appendiculata TaxID=2587402 RepID=A0AAN6Z163_9PEZI|nr:NAD(P)-binding protein [Parathielavia appendiculata]
MPASSPRKSNGVEVSSFVNNHNDTYPHISPAIADLSGKSMLITGASKGLGKAIAIRFAMVDCSKIALVARSPLSEAEKEVKAAAAAAGHPEPHVLKLNVNVSSEASVRNAADVVSQAFGGSLDVLIANAGYSADWDHPLAKSDPSEWWKTWETNINGTYLSARFFTPQVLASSLKTVIVLSSVGAHHIYPGASSYQTQSLRCAGLPSFSTRSTMQRGWWPLPSIRAESRRRWRRRCPSNCARS